MQAVLKEPTVANVSVNTLAQGTISVPETDLITFAQPLVGFDHLKRFVLLPSSTHSKGPLWWLQSVEEVQVTFCLLDVFATGLDPDFELAPADIKDLGAADAAELAVYTMVVLDHDPAKIRTNLRAPILLCRATGKAKQVVFTDSALPIQCFFSEIAARVTAQSAHAPSALSRMPLTVGGVQVSTAKPQPARG